LAFGGDTYEKLSFKTVLSKSHLNLYNFNYLFDELTPGLDKDFDGRPKRARLWGFESILAKKERLSDETEIEDLEQIVAPFIKSFKSLGQTQRLSFNYYRNEGMVSLEFFLNIKTKFWFSKKKPFYYIFKKNQKLVFFQKYRN
jgi:hypothetical protein